MLRFKRIMVCLAIGIAVTGLVSAQTIQINRENKTIAISTTDEATATADIAIITIGFKMFGSDSLKLSADCGKVSHAIVGALHKAGVDDKAIESSAQGLEPNTEFSDKDTADLRTKEVFVFRQSWEVSVAPQLAAEVIQVAIAAGANKSGDIAWRLSDRKSLQAKAAENALAKAREVATRMADGLHVKLGALIYASNDTPNAELYLYRPKPGLAMYTESASVSSREVSPSLEIRPQTIREEATVYAVFAIE